MSLLVAHGLGRCATEWLSCAAAIDRSALVPDLTELRRTDGKPDTNAVIATLLAVLDRRSISTATWLGHSGGAHVMLEAAIEHPARVASLVLVSAVPSRRLLAQVRCSVLVVLGAEDGLRVEPLDHVRVATIAGARHDPHLEAPDAFVALIRNTMSTR